MSTEKLSLIDQLYTEWNKWVGRIITSEEHWAQRAGICE